jgi:hypothetical protein
MKIEQVERWLVGEREFSSEAAARQYEEDQIGEFMDKYLLANTVLSPKDRLHLHANIIEHRAALLRLLET